MSIQLSPSSRIVFGKFIWRVEESDEAGRFLVATRDIRKGEVPNIFKESAIIKIKIKININTDIKIHILSTSSSSTLQKGGVIWSPSGRRSNLHTDSACLSWVPEVVQVLVEMIKVSQPAGHFQTQQAGCSTLPPASSAKGVDCLSAEISARADHGTGCYNVTLASYSNPFDTASELAEL